jgi:alpha-tubulin suppressor-like RCC1 family protein
LLSGVNIAEVATDWYTTCARSTTGNVYCWGDNVNGSVGDGTNVPRLAPVQVLSGSRKIRGAGFHFCSLQMDDSVQCWGANESGQLGDGSHTTSTKPIPMKL